MSKVLEVRKAAVGMLGREEEGGGWKRRRGTKGRGETAGIVQGTFKEVALCNQGQGNGSLVGSSPVDIDGVDYT